MTDNSMIEQGKGIMARLEELQELLTIARKKEADAKIKFERAKDNLAKKGRDLTLSLSPRLEGATDPKTGKPNKEWAMFLLDQMMENDAEYVNEQALYYHAQEDLHHTQVEVIDLSDQLGILKSRGAIWRGLVRLLTAEEIR